MDVTDLLRDRVFESQFTEVFVARLGLYISGIEVTQAIQFYEADDHLTDPADRQANNAVRLVSGKPAWVRVYVGSVFGAGGVTGTLEVQRRQLGYLWQTVATLTPHGSSLTSVPASSSTSYAATRGTIGNTLNFVIPADEMIGSLRLIARVSSGVRTVERTIDVGVTLRQTLRLAGVMISYNGPASMAQNAPNLTIAAPALTDLQNMSGLALRLFPVESTAEFRVAGTLAQTNHLQDAVFPASGCGAEWDALHARVAGVRTADGNRPGWIYYGLLPSGVPMGPVGGCGGGGVAVGPTGQPGTLAHEAGHAAGLPHAPSGGAPNADANFPAYEPYDPAGTPQGRDGEYGLDVDNGQVKSPATFRDIMGYAGPQWISPYNYGRLTDNTRFTPTTVGVDDFWWKDIVWEEWPRFPRIPIPDPPYDLPVFPPTLRERVVSLIVRIDHGKVAEDVTVIRTAAHTELPRAGSTPYTVRLRDAAGEIISAGELVRLTTAASGCGGCGGRGADGRPPARYVAQAFLPDVGPGATLEIAVRDDVVWRREAPAELPRLEVARPKVDRRGAISLAWESSGAKEFWVRWSDDKETWSSVETEVTEGRITLAPGTLPVGAGFLQVVAHDGFHSTESEPIPVDVPSRPPQLAVLHPQDGRTYPAGYELRLFASAIGAPADDAVWLVDGQKVAQGLDAWTAFEPGDHKVTIAAGGAEQTVVVHIEKGER